MRVHFEQWRMEEGGVVSPQPLFNLITDRGGVPGPKDLGKIKKGNKELEKWTKSVSGRREPAARVADL